jgi:lysozyme
MSPGTKVVIIAGLALLLLLHPADASAAESIIQKFEGLRLSAYPDAGSYAIGYGSQWNYDAGRPVRASDKITQETALKWLRIRNDENRRLLDSLVRVSLNQHQVDSLLSLIYNIGSGNFTRSALLSRLNAGRPKAEVAEGFDHFTTSQGKVNPDLVARRAAEKKLFLS